MSMPRQSFTPYEAPAQEDVGARAVRLATALAVLSMMTSAPPSPGLLENLREADMLDRWPLRDEQSAAGVAMLRAVALARDGALHEDFQDLLGPAGRISPVLPDDEVASIVADCSALGFRAPHSGGLPTGHIAALMARAGFLATARRQAIHAGDHVQAEALRAALARLIGESLGPLAEQVAREAQEHARTSMYAALAPLLRGAVAEADSLCSQRAPMAAGTADDQAPGDG